MVKKILPWAVVVFMVALLIIGFTMKETMNDYLSKIMKEQTSPDIKYSAEVLVDSLYNYSENGSGYEITFFEFGSKGCVACARMEDVLGEVRLKYSNQINVVFLNILKPENQNLMKMYGIATIPTQVLLDKNGEEFFRHSGYISFVELENKFPLLKK